MKALARLIVLAATLAGGTLLLASCGNSNTPAAPPTPVNNEAPQGMRNPSGTAPTQMPTPPPGAGR